MKSSSSRCWIINFWLNELKNNNVWNLQKLASALAGCLCIKSLEKIHFPFDRLPESICDLNRLVHLDLSFNGISRVPSGINRLVSLQYLNFSNNHIKDIPRGLYQVNTNNINDEQRSICFFWFAKVCEVYIELQVHVGVHNFWINQSQINIKP